MTFGPLWLAVAFLLSFADCSTSGWEMKGILVQFGETLFGDPHPSTCHVDHPNMPMCVGGAQGAPQHLCSSSFTTIKVVDSIYSLQSGLQQVNLETLGISGHPSPNPYPTPTSPDSTLTQPSPTLTNPHQPSPKHSASNQSVAPLHRRCLQHPLCLPLPLSIHGDPQLDNSSLEAMAGPGVVALTKQSSNQHA